MLMEVELLTPTRLHSANQEKVMQSLTQPFKEHSLLDR